MVIEFAYITVYIPGVLTKRQHSNKPKHYIFVREVPYWTAKRHGKKYRLMYQVYTLPKYIEHGKRFFEGVNERYTEYAKQLEPKIGTSIYQ